MTRVSLCFCTLLFLASPCLAQSGKSAKPSYARDVAPIFVESCLGCHGGAGGLSLADFERVMKGGNSGEIVVASEPGSSLLIDKLKGSAGARMPLRKPPLSDDAIAKIEAWIAAGAKYDGDNPTQPTDELVRTSAAAAMRHDELAADRLKRARANWELALPGREPVVRDSLTCLVLSTAEVSKLDPLVAAADKAQRDIAKLLKLPAGAPLIKGRLTVFAFEKRYDYGEFGRMVEKRDLPRQWRGHSRFNSIDAYACLVLPRTDEYSLDAELARQTMAVYLEGRGEMPSWFVQGSALATAIKLHKKAPELVELVDRQRALASSLSDPKALLEGKLPDDEFEPLAAGVAGFLLTDTTRYRKLLDAVTSGTPFDAAIKNAYGAPAEEIVAMWQKKQK